MIRQLHWPKNEQVTFTGRNGTMFCAGIEVMVLNYKNIPVPRIQLTPITSKGKIGRCDIDVPADKIDELIAVLQEAKETFIYESSISTRSICECGGTFDERDRCSDCDAGHDDCEIQECFVCYERWMGKAEAEAEGER